MKIPSILLLTTLLLSCMACSEPDYTQAKQTPPYIVSKIDSTFQAQWKGSSTPPPLPLFYGDYNFIVDNDSEQIYLHKKKQIFRFCGTGVDFTKPDFIALSPQDFVLLTHREIESYFADTLTNLNDRQAVVLASLQDSIKMKEARTLIDSLFISRKIKRFYIRRITEEEEVVLNHKKQNLPYSADSIKWSGNFSEPNYIPQDII
ncbi:hypothetical protein [Pontibacter mangrovi]|uniref:hypothetical protein n=1 Tax=Pontibacter mangrovi TaxID=2589816 RepID=UPI001EEF8E03|nr:hypothetical protein [Pontibacter mangrovi]